MGRCEVLNEGHYKLHLLPEDEPINPSPWYGFKVTKTSTLPHSPIKVTLFYGDHVHRYHPKISEDFEEWRRLSTEQLVRIADNEIELTFSNIEEQLFVSAQPPINNEHYEAWLTSTQKEWPSSEILTLGFSHARSPIKALVANPSATKIILLIGRAHPPELPGAVAYIDFVEYLLAVRTRACASRSAICQFFLDHELILVPNLNPDGVAAGYWRHNLGSTDLNRDWGKFQQPETSSVNQLLMEKLKSGDTLTLMLDFHATNRNVLYTQTDADDTTFPNFAKAWIQAREEIATLPEIEHAPREFDSGKGTSKNYFFELSGSPSITVEIGDNTTREETKALATQFSAALISVFNAQSNPSNVLQTRERSYFHLMALGNTASLIELTDLSYITEEEAVQIYNAQSEILEEIRDGEREASSNYLDLEAALIEKLGSFSSNAHLGRSRQDMHGITRRMLARDGLLSTMASLIEMRRALHDRLVQEKETPIPIFTHGVPAQPTTFAHQLTAFSYALARDFDRLRDAYSRLNIGQLGAMAGVGSSIPFDREKMARFLGFSDPVQNTFDANFLSTNDYKLEVSSALSVSATNVSMFVENVHSQLRYPTPWIYLGSEGTSLSSSMPQKRNPRPLDRLRTAVNNVIGRAHTQQLHAHNVDTGMHDYRTVNNLLETMDSAREMYTQFADLVAMLQVDQVKVVEILNQSHATSSGLVEHLNEKYNLSVRDANQFVQQLIQIAREDNQILQDLADQIYQSLFEEMSGFNVSDLEVEEMKSTLEISNFLASRTTSGGPSSSAIRYQIQDNKGQIETDSNWLHIQEATLTESEHLMAQKIQSYLK